jgi:hypothetical protein
MPSSCTISPEPAMALAPPVASRRHSQAAVNPGARFGCHRRESAASSAGSSRQRVLAAVRAARRTNGEPFFFGSIILEPSLNGLPSGGPFRFLRRKSRSLKGICGTRLLPRLARQSATPTLSASRKPAVRTAGDAENAPELSLPLSCAQDPS